MTERGTGPSRLAGGAIGLGIAARKDMEKDPNLDGKGLAIGGQVTGAIGAVLAIVLLATGTTNF